MEKIRRLILWLKTNWSELTQRQRIAAIVLIIIFLLTLCVGTTMFVLPTPTRGKATAPSAAMASMGIGRIIAGDDWITNNLDVKVLFATVYWEEGESAYDRVESALNVLKTTPGLEEHQLLVRMMPSEYSTVWSGSFYYDSAMPLSQANTGEQLNVVAVPQCTTGQNENVDYCCNNPETDTQCLARRPNFQTQADNFEPWIDGFATRFADDPKLLGMVIGGGVAGEAIPYIQTQGDTCNQCEWRQAANLSGQSDYSQVFNWIVPLATSVGELWSDNDKWILVHLASTYVQNQIGAGWRDQLQPYNVGVWDSGLDPGPQSCYRWTTRPNVSRWDLSPLFDWNDELTWKFSMGSQAWQPLNIGRSVPSSAEFGGGGVGQFNYFDNNFEGAWWWNAYISATNGASGMSFWSEDEKPAYALLPTDLISWINKFVGVEPVDNDTLFIVFKGRHPNSDAWCPNYFNYPYGINSDLELADRWTAADSASSGNGGAAGNVDELSDAVEYSNTNLTNTDHRYLSARYITDSAPIYLDIEDAWATGGDVTVALSYLGSTGTIRIDYVSGGVATTHTVEKDTLSGWHTTEFVIPDIDTDNQIAVSAPAYYQQEAGVQYDVKLSSAGDGSDIVSMFTVRRGTGELDTPTPTPILPQQVELPAEKDTFITAWEPDVPKGTLENIVTRSSAGSIIYKSLIYFDISSIPTDVIINSATMQLNAYQEQNAGFGQTVDVYKLAKTWEENQTTWNDSTTGTAWATAGAGAANVDYVDVLIASESVTLGSFSWDVTAAVQDWFGGSDNHGFLLVPDTTQQYKYFDSLDATRTDNEKPILRVSYTEFTPTPAAPTETPVPVPTATFTPEPDTPEPPTPDPNLPADPTITVEWEDVHDSGANQSHPAIAYDTANAQMLLIWDDGRNDPQGAVDTYGMTNNSDVYGQLFNNTGTPVASEIIVANGGEYQTTGRYDNENWPVLTFNTSSNRYHAAYMTIPDEQLATGDFITGTCYDAGTTILDDTGTVIDTVDDLAWYTVPPGQTHPTQGWPYDWSCQQEQEVIQFNGGDVMHLIQDHRERYAICGADECSKDVYAQIVSNGERQIVSSQLISHQDGTGNVRYPFHQETMDVAGDSGAWFVIWSDERNTNDTLPQASGYRDIYGRFVYEIDGNVTTGTEIALAIGVHDSFTFSRPRIGWMPTRDAYVIVMPADNELANTQHIYYMVVDSTGATIQPLTELATVTGDNYPQPDVACDQDYCVVAYRPAGDVNAIRFQVMRAREWTFGDELIDLTGSRVSYPKIEFAYSSGDDHKFAFTYARDNDIQFGLINITGSPAEPPTPVPDTPEPTETPVIPPTQTPTPTPVVLSCVNANLQPTPGVAGDDITYTIDNAPSGGDSYQIRWRYNSGFVNLCGPANETICTMSAVGSTMQFWTDIYREIDGFDYTCSISGWSPEAPEVPAECNNDCNVETIIHTPSPTPTPVLPPDTATPVPPPTETPVIPPTETPVPPTETPVPVPTTVVLACDGANAYFDPDPVVEGGNFSYNLTSDPTGGDRWVMLAGDAANFSLCNNSPSSCNVNGAIGTEAGGDVRIYYEYEEIDYYCDGSGTWVPFPPFPASCQNTCANTTEIVQPTPTPMDTATPVPVATQTPVPPPTDTPGPDPPTATPVPPPTSTPIVSGLSLNEVAFGNTDANENGYIEAVTDQCIEVYNPTGSIVNMTGWSIWNGSKRLMYYTTIVLPHGHQVLWGNQFATKLDATGVFLYDDEMNLIDSVSTTVLDQAAIARMPDGNTWTSQLSLTTCGYRNYAP